MKISFAEFEPPRAGAVVVGVWEEGALTPRARQFDEASGGAVTRALAASPRFRGKRNELVPIVGPAGLSVSRIVLVGLGKPDAMDARGLEDLGGTLVAHLNGVGESAATFAIDIGDAADFAPAAAAAHLAFGAALRAYRFDKYRTTEKPERKPTLAALTVAAPAASAACEVYKALRRDRGSRRLYPRSRLRAGQCDLSRDVGRAGRRPLGIRSRSRDPRRGAQMRALGMNAILGVAQGSVRPPRLVVMRWNGGAAGAAPLAFIGKGVTFDTGGISIKPAAGMGEMKWDKAGAGVVIGLMRLLAARAAKVNAVGVVGLVENMPSGSAMRPGDIIASMSGQTIEVLNTDAEGRLVLADALWYCQDRFKPALMIDLATLTGAIIVALGHDHAGLFANDDTLAERLVAAGKVVGEKLWRLPLDDAYNRQIDSDAADVKNIAGDRAAGSIIGAEFVQRFVNKVPWAHLDIAGVAWSKKDAPTVPKGATAFGVRLLDRFVADYYEKD